jgi:D-lactate dehydrogenase
MTTTEAAVKSAAVAIFEAEPGERETLARALAAHRLAFVEAPLAATGAMPGPDTDVVSVFIGSRVDEAALARLPALKLVATRSTGYDHVDLAACARRGVAVANVPSYGTNTVAEHTFGLMLAVSRRIAATYHRVLNGQFDREGLRGFDLAGKTLGVIGTGHIGAHVIRIARGFSMRVLAYDPAPDDKLEAALTFEYVDLDRLLAEADVVTLHAPANPSTLHMLDARALRRMKRGAVLVNTGRGSLVDTPALVEALREGHLGGAGLDVLEGEQAIFDERQVLARGYDRDQLERLVAGHALMHMPNVVLTPHNAFNSEEALQRILDTTVGNIESFLAGTPRHLVAAR